MTFDVRAVANFVLDEAEEAQISISNLAINKIVFFLHAEHLAKFGEPLVNAKIEAWKFGPVFRELYSEFKKHQHSPIASRATKINVEVGGREICTIDSREPIVNDLRQWIRVYMRLTPFQLVELSHAPGGPWDSVFNHDRRTNPGMHISNEVILEAFGMESQH